MTIAALQRLLDQEQPDVVRPPAPKLPPRRTHPRSQETHQVDAYNAVALSMNADGYSDQQIADRLGIDIEEASKIIDTNLAPAAQEPDEADERGQDEESAAGVPGVEDLLAWAAAHDDRAVRKHADQARESLNALRQRRAADDELATIQGETEKLSQRLQELREREALLRPKTGKKQRPARDYDPREVREWARSNGFEVPDRGQIPKKVLEAWRTRSGATQLRSVS
jgi:hypothetical protein